jgi:hypothetical protein
MMDMPEALLLAIPLSTFIVTTGAVVIKRLGSDTKRTDLALNRPLASPAVCQGHCYDHEGVMEKNSGLTAKIEELKTGQKESRAELLKKSDDLWSEVKIIQGDVKTLLRQKTGG